MKVKDLPYERYKIEQLKNALDKFETAAENAKSANEILNARKLFLNEYKKYSTECSLANCRFTLNTKDQFYIDEMEYYDNVAPLANEIIIKYGDIMLTTPFRSEMEKFINPLCYKNYEVNKKSYSPIVEKECQKENALVTEYSKFMAELGVEWQGKKMPLAYVRGFLEAEDRNVRKDAATAIGNALAENSETLDSIYDNLVKVRTEIARKMGYENFVELGYYRMNRIDYDKNMVEEFRNNVLNDLVPIVKKIKDNIAQEFGFEKLYFYDDAIYIKGGNPRPKDGADGIFKNAREMYREMNPEVGAFMDSMLENEAFDVEARDGKFGGGYCTEFALYKQPFILANFNGTAGDIDVITHEFGHALASHEAFKANYEDLTLGMETAECHSMSMEFFCEKYMDKFFNKPDDYRKSHLLSSICFIPYGVIVDEFQQNVYEHPEMTPAERKSMYKKLEEKYRPYMTFEGIPYLEDGTRWQYQMHIYESPFYYIDYCLAQTVSLSFLVEMTDDYDRALSRYLDFVKSGSSKKFSQLVEDAGLPNPFIKGTLKKLADKLNIILDKYN